MADLDIPGLNSARALLTKMGKTRGNMQGWGRSEMIKGIVQELYPEIRAARIAGHSWKKISEALDSTILMPMSDYALRKYFAIVDREYEKETGIAALPVKDGRRKNKERTRKVSLEA